MQKWFEASSYDVVCARWENLSTGDIALALDFSKLIPGSISGLDRALAILDLKNSLGL